MNNLKKNVLIGFNIHPLWLSGTDLESFISPLRDNGLRSLEFEVDSNLPGWEQFEPLMENCSDIGMEICFHAPYRPHYSLYDFCGIRREEICNINKPLWSLADSWGVRNDFRTEIVVHGATLHRSHSDSNTFREQEESKEQVTKEKLREDTKGFITWTLETFPNLTIALENLDVAKPGVIKFGGRREDVLSLVTEIDHPRLGICWDMGHDIRHGVTQDPSREWLEHVVHVHVHDIDDNGEDHFPLVFDKVPNAHWIQLLMDAGMEGTITLELKGGNLVNWELERINYALAKSIKTINEVIK